MAEMISVFGIFGFLALLVLAVLAVLLPVFVLLIRRDVAEMRAALDNANQYLYQLAKAAAPGVRLSAPPAPLGDRVVLPPESRRRPHAARVLSSTFDGEDYGQA